MKYFLRISALFLTLQIVFATTHIFAQEALFIPAKYDSVYSQTVLHSLEKKYRQNIEKLPEQDRKDLAKVYKERWENIREKFIEKELYTEKNAREYLEALVNEITAANPLLQNHSFQCHFSRSGIPNAAYLGEGLILFNIGLFSRLENESQAAFIICHELAHYYLRHSENSIDTYVTTMNSKEVQKELKNIKKAEFGKRAVLEELMKGLTFNSRRHGRLHESQADSMAVELMRNTRFQLSEALTTLALLDSIDTDTQQMEATLRHLFDLPDYPFQTKWIAKEEGLLGGHTVMEKDEQLTDSLKTHPDCLKRIQLLEPVIQQYSTSAGKHNPVNESQFRKLSQHFRFEVIDYYFDSDNLTKSLQHTITLLKDYPADPYLLTQVGKIFNGLYNAQTKHTLSKVIELPAPYYTQDYNLLLQFIQNLYKDDFAAISYHFLQQYADQMQAYPSFKKIYQTSKMNYKP